ncbi:LysR substrate-binding domain-containing protein [Arcobacter sp. CECT 8985]|uniref:LysR substrate-binding domain-containing protein n=1 Tax=Arcobacter sp. CECT 8985 TaxID=1935424 RepID=UPI00100A86E8|nr:LysR substrate-binding domain-containing protein [Arcobacter sp. CECT 8985]RXJ87125.1 LysR family transcriptional regulator [Arcobacter sp. CECT 8985]
MDSNLLKVFLSVANNRSFSKASVELNCAQSNVTARIKQLEKSIDKILFYRNTKGIILTDIAKKLLPYANEVVNSINKAEDFLKHIEHEETLKIGTTESSAVTKVVTLLNKIHKKYPKMDLELTTSPTKDLKELLLEYKIDIAFISGKPKEKEFKILKEYKEELVLLKSKKNKHSNNILSFKKGCTYRQYMEDYLKQQKIKYKNIEFGSLETILGCVKLGMGITILPLSVVQKLNLEEDLFIEKLPDYLKNIHTYMICRINDDPLISNYLKKQDL